MRATGSRSVSAVPGSISLRGGMGLNVVLLSLLGLVAVIAFVGFRLRRSNSAYRTVRNWEHGLLYVDGRFKRLLDAGRYRVLHIHEHTIVTLPRLPRFEPITNTDVTSADKLSYRMSAVLGFEIVDPRIAHEGEYREHLRLAVSEALVRLAATRSVEAILEERAGIGEAALALLPPSICGCKPLTLNLTALALPPELRRLYSEIERARLESQAALERARGEQAALRSLANSARLLKGNPELMNLRLLQALSSSGGRRGATLVLGREAFAATATDTITPPGEDS